MDRNAHLPLPAAVEAQLAEARAAVVAVLGREPPPNPLGLVLGSGLSGVVDRLRDPATVGYADIPHLPVPRAEGHRGRLVVGKLEGAPVVALAGRAHLYEGHAPAQVVFGARLLARLGCRAVVLTNAAGGIAAGLSPGDLMLIRDHLNLTGRNPLAGAVDEAVGPAFLDVRDTYPARLRAVAQEVARELRGAPLVEGVYAGLLGPSYETEAEVSMLSTLGADAVGMSTVLEAIALRHQGVDVLGLSTITNAAAGRPGAVLDHRDVQRVAGEVAAGTAALLEALAERLEGQPLP